jgi:hypothetical protein
MSRKSKRPLLCVAISHDGRAGVGVIVVGLRGPVARQWERVMRGSASLHGPAMDAAVQAAREAELRSLDIGSPYGLAAPPPEICEELGGVRVRFLHRRKIGPERSRAHRRLRELVPLPKREEESYSWADYGIDLEIARFEEAAGAAMEASKLDAAFVRRGRLDKTSSRR